MKTTLTKIYRIITINDIRYFIDRRYDDRFLNMTEMNVPEDEYSSILRITIFSDHVVNLKDGTLMKCRNRFDPKIRATFPDLNVDD